MEPRDIRSIAENWRAADKPEVGAIWEATAEICERQDAILERLDRLVEMQNRTCEKIGRSPIYDHQKDSCSLPWGHSGPHSWEDA